MRATLLLLLVTIPACASPGMPYGHTDGGSDAGAMRDAFAPGIDAFAPGIDAFVPGIDAFAPGIDASTAPGIDAWRAPVDAGDDAGSDAGHDAGSDAGHDAGAVTPGPGSYLYSRTPIGGMHEAVVAAFHPDGSYALVLERDTNVRVYDWAARTALAFDLRVAGRALTLTDVSFDPAGTSAYVVGYETVSGANTGVVIRFDDATWRATPTLAAFTRTTITRSGERFVGIERPAPGEGPVGDGRPVLLSQSGTSSYIARLRDVDPTTDTFGAFIQAQPTSAGCDDLAFAHNEFGTWGIVLACGTNGADAPYYTEVGGTPEWRPGPPATLGNASRAASHGSGDYALVVSWSGRDLDRFQAGAWHDTATVPGWPAIGVWDVSFSPDGARALIVGRASGGASLVGTVLEYRHDLYTTSAITDVSIPAFASAPYLGTSNTNLNDSAFRPGCDGGLVVGGETSFSGSTGMIVEFQLEGGRLCR